RRQRERRLLSDQLPLRRWPGPQVKERDVRQNLTMTIACLAVLSAAPAKAVKITEYTIPTAASYPEGITAGPDGRMWFCESATDKVGAITPAGVVTEYPIRSGAGCMGIAAAHGILYYTEQKAGKVGAMATN